MLDPCAAAPVKSDFAAEAVAFCFTRPALAIVVEALRVERDVVIAFAVVITAAIETVVSFPVVATDMGLEVVVISLELVMRIAGKVSEIVGLKLLATEESVVGFVVAMTDKELALVVVLTLTEDVITTGCEVV